MSIPLLQRLRDIRETLETRGRAVAAQYAVGRLRQLAGMAYYNRRLRVGRNEYYLFELFDPRRTHEEKLRFLSGNRFRQFRDVLNDPAARVLIDDKHAFGRILWDGGVSTPEEIALLETGEALPYEAWCEQNDAMLRSIFEIAAQQGITFKPRFGKQGGGILVFSGVADGALVHANGERYSVQRLHEAVHQTRKGYLVQRRLTNHADFNRLNPHTLATVRVVTCLEDGEPWVLRATFKVPLGRRGVDNVTAGALACPVDVETGRLGPAVSWHGFERTSTHPDSGVVFEGTLLPRWADVIETAHRAARLFPVLRSLGWDIAITDDGPAVIEANYSWGVEIVQRPQGQGLNHGRFKRWYERVLLESSAARR